MDANLKFKPKDWLFSGVVGLGQHLLDLNVLLFIHNSTYLNYLYEFQTIGRDFRSKIKMFKKQFAYHKYRH